MTEMGRGESVGRSRMLVIGILIIGGVMSNYGHPRG